MECSTPVGGGEGFGAFLTGAISFAEPFFDGAKDAVESVEDFVCASIEGAVNSAGLGGIGDATWEPVFAWWEANQAPLQTAVSLAQNPITGPIIGIPAEVLAFTMDTLATCSLSDATSRAACRMTQKVTAAKPILQDRWVSDQVAYLGGNPAKAAWSSLQAMAYAADLVAKPFCEKRMPTASNVLTLTTAIGVALQRIRDAGGIEALDTILDQVLDRFLNPAAAQCIRDGGDTQTCAALATQPVNDQPAFTVSINPALQVIAQQAAAQQAAEAAASEAASQPANKPSAVGTAAKVGFGIYFGRKLLGV